MRDKSDFVGLAVGVFSLLAGVGLIIFRDMVPRTTSEWTNVQVMTWYGLVTTFIIAGITVLIMVACGDTAPLDAIRFRRKFGFLPANWRYLHRRGSPAWEIESERTRRVLQDLAVNLMRADCAERPVQAKMHILGTLKTDELKKLHKEAIEIAAAVKRDKKWFWAAHQLAKSLCIEGVHSNDQYSDFVPQELQERIRQQYAA